MPKKTATIIIEECGECPYFDNEYYSYNQKCLQSDRIIKWDKKKRRYPIPDDCPLAEELPPPGTFTVADIDASLERGKEIGIAMASGPCMFCGKKTNECECGHAEIAKGMIDTEFPSRVQQRAWTLAEYRDWLDNKEQENAD